MLRHIVLALCLIAAIARPAPAQTAATHATVRSVQAIRTSVPIVVDGRLDEEIWQRAPAAGDFTQTDPDDGKPATERIELRVLYDSAALYVGAHLYDSEPSKIARQLARRDGEAEADVFALFLDPHHDHLTGASFSVSAAGVQSDATIYNDSWQDNSWDAVWESAVTIDQTGWTVEMRIRLSQLRFPAAQQHTFGINAMRYIQRKNERDWLVRVPKTESGLASRFAHLEGLTGLSPHRTIEFMPYLSSREELVAPPSPGDPFNDGTRLVGDTGLDLKYRMSSNLSLDATVNPDFGQVEVDPAVVNLTAFETFFEEKRPFFIEGANIFGNFGRSGSNSFWGFNRSEPIIFYSRRIGRAPEGSADGDFVDRPQSSTILGAAKLTGKTRNGWSLGFLEAVTGREYAQTLSSTGRSKAEIEPLTNYFVGRAEREIGRRAAVGMLTTAVTRNLRTPALANLLPTQAYVSGFDGHYFLDQKRDWVLTGSISGGYLTGGTEAIDRLQHAPQRYYQRPDATHLHLDPQATSLSGWTGSINLNRNSGVNGLNAALWGVSPGFDSSDAGFSFNNDRAGMHVAYQWRNPNVTRVARNRFLAVAKFYTWNFGREIQSDGTMTFGNVTFKNYWTAFGNLGFFRSVQDDRVTRGGPSMLAPGARSGSIGLSSDSRKRVSMDFNVSLDASQAGGFNRSAGVSLKYRPSSSLEISTGPNLQRSHQLAQYVGTFADPAAAATFGSRYVFATLDQHEFSLQTRINYVLSPKASLQVYMQPLVSVGDYEGFKQLARARTFDFVRFGIDGGTVVRRGSQYLVSPGSDGTPFTFDDPDFNLKSLRLNAIFRWEWKPGSAMYIVWTEQRADHDRPGQFALGHDVSRVFSAPADDVILFKITYWFQR